MAKYINCSITLMIQPNSDASIMPCPPPLGKATLRVLTRDMVQVRTDAASKALAVHGIGTHMSCAPTAIMVMRSARKCPKAPLAGFFGAFDRGKAARSQGRWGAISGRLVGLRLFGFAVAALVFFGHDELLGKMDFSREGVGVKACLSMRPINAMMKAPSASFRGTSFRGHQKLQSPANPLKGAGRRYSSNCKSLALCHADKRPKDTQPSRQYIRGRLEFTWPFALLCRAAAN